MPGLKRGDFYIGSMQLIDRKKPCLVVMRGNQCHVVGNFINTHCVEDFQKALEEMFGGEKENGNDEKKID